MTIVTDLIAAAKALDAKAQGEQELFLGDTWYRFVDVEYWEEGCDEPDRRILCIEWHVVEETDVTVLLVRRQDLNEYGIPMEGVEKRRVLKNARKRFAYPTKKLALASYTARKRWQIMYAERTVDRAKAMLAAVSLVQGFLAGAE